MSKQLTSEKNWKSNEMFDSGFYRRIIDQLRSNVYITDVETDEIVYMNDYMKQTFQLPDPEGKICWQVLQKDQKGRCSFCKIHELQKNPDRKECIWREQNPVTGRTYMNVDVLETWEGKQYHVQNSTDITDKLQLTIDASIDDLTMLLNRKAGRRRLEETLKNLADEEQLIVSLCDVNGLKWVNDELGHYEGDRLLRYIAQNMSAELEGEDFIFRLSGDEFIVVFYNREQRYAEEWMNRMLDFLRNERSEAGIEYEVSFSYGLARIRGKDRLTVSDALSLADTQMYIQKRDYHIRQGRERLLRQEPGHGKEKKEFEYNQEYLFDAFSEVIDGYAYIGNLKTGEFMYSYKMVKEFGLPKPVLHEAAAFWGERIHPEDKDFFLQSNQEIADGRTERHTITYRAMNARGEWVKLLCKGRMIRDEQGVPELFAGVIRNLDDPELQKNGSTSVTGSFYFMTDQDTTQRQSEIEQALRQFVNHSIPQGLIAVEDSRDFPIICFNGSFLTHVCRMTYNDFCKTTGGSFRKFIYEEDRERVMPEIQKQLSEMEKYEIYYRIVRGDGCPVWVYDTGRYAYNADGVRVILSFLMEAAEQKDRTE